MDSKHHLITDGGGIPLAVTLTGANRNDVTQLLPLLDAVPPVRGRRGRPRRRPDRAYDHDTYRRQVRAKGVRPVIARRGVEHGSGLGAHRWVVEQALALRWSVADRGGRDPVQPAPTFRTAEAQPMLQVF